MTFLPSRIAIWCWLIFVVYWFVSALRVKPAVERQSRLSSLAHRVPLVIGAILLWFPVRHGMLTMATPRDDVTSFVGAAVCVLGLCVAIWARRTIAGNWSSDVTFKQNHELIQTGPYRFARHPIYTGILAMALGIALVGGGLGRYLGFLLMGVGLWIKLTQEERLLLRHFPNDYPAYQKRVKALLPFII